MTVPGFLQFIARVLRTLAKNKMNRIQPHSPDAGINRCLDGIR